MTDLDIVQRVAEMWEQSITTCRPQKETHKVSYKCTIRGFPAISWLEQLRPLLGIRRKKQIDKALACYENRSVHKLSYEKAKEIRVLLDEGLTQREIAVRFGVAQQAVSNIKTGKHYIRA